MNINANLSKKIKMRTNKINTHKKMKKLEKQNKQNKQ